MVLFFSKKVIMPRLLLIIIWLLGLAFLIVPRLLFDKLYRPGGPLNILYLSDPEDGFSCKENHKFHITFIRSDIKRPKEIKSILLKKHIDTMIVNSNKLHKTFLISLCLFCERHGIDFFYALEGPFDEKRMYKLILWEGLTFLYTDKKNYTFTYSLIKRAMDLCISFSSLPFIFIFYSYLYIKNKACPLTKKKVKGHNNHVFDIYTFKTDISPFLNKTGVKYLPLFLNVIKNDMTIVGIALRRYNDLKETHKIFKPGLIGLGSVFENELHPLFDDQGLDFNYAINPNILMDVCIIMFFLFNLIKSLLKRTLSCIFARE